MNISEIKQSLNEKGYDFKTKKDVILIDKNYIRPLDVNTLLGNAAKARKKLSWKPKINIDQLIEEMILDVILNGDEPPRNRIRKVIFKPFTRISKEDKLRIVGRLIGRSIKVCADDIYEVMIDLNDMGKKITIGRIAGLLDCSSRTIHRNMCTQLKREKELLNKQL